METIIISSSLSNSSKSKILAKYVETELNKKKINTTLIDLKEFNLNPTHKESTPDREELIEILKRCDNIVFAFGIHCYSISDSLKIFLETCCEGLKEKFYGILCSAGSDKSYLSTQHLTQICQNQWKMIQLPHIIYATGKDFSDEEINNDQLIERLDQFCDKFVEIGNKLL